MSHFSYIKTRIQNLGYLEKALNKLNIHYELDSKIIKGYDNDSLLVDLIIPQKNGYDIGFKWNGVNYELVTDLSFWDQKYSNETFMDKLTQTYASQIILNETKRQGFNNIEEKTNIDGSISIVLERWN